MLNIKQLKHLQEISEAGSLGRIYSEEVKHTLDDLKKLGLIDLDAQMEFPFTGKPVWSLTAFITPKGRQYLKDQKTKNYRSNPDSLITVAIKRPGLSLETIKVTEGNYQEKFNEIIGSTFELRTYSLGLSFSILMAVDEFGKDKNLPYNFLWAEYGDPIHGTAIFIKETLKDQLVSLTAMELVHLRGATKI